MSETKCDDVHFDFGEINKKNKPPVIYKNIDGLNIYLSYVYVLRFGEDLFRFQIIYTDDKIFSGFTRLSHTAGNFLELHIFSKSDGDPQEKYRNIFKNLLYDGYEIMCFEDDKEFFEYANNFYDKRGTENV